MLKSLQMCVTHRSFGFTNSTYAAECLLSESEESALAGYHYTPTVLFVPNCTMSPCGEQIHEQNTQGEYSSVCVPESLCFSKEMIAGPFLILYYSEFKTGMDME